MKTILFSISITLCSCLSVIAQTSDSLDRMEIMRLVPDQYDLLDYAIGDINLDSLPDAVVVLKIKGEDTLPMNGEEVSRPVLLLVLGTDQKLILNARNDSAMLGKWGGGPFGDPYSGIEIKKGMFTLIHYGGGAWRWSRADTFKYSGKKRTWYLIQDIYDTFKSLDPDVSKTTVRTTKQLGKISFKKFNINKL